MPHFRPIQISDIPALMGIRASVRENRLVHRRIEREDYLQALAEGHGFVCEVDGTVVGFVCGRLSRQDIWALFLEPAYEGQGLGSALLRLMEDWMFAHGVEEMTLSTAPGTRAEWLYRKRGWTADPEPDGGELTFRRRRPAPPSD